MNWAVILVSPKGERNVGGVARLMGNFGFSDLRIVDPRCDLKDLEVKKMAMTSYDIIQNAKIYKNFEEAQADRTYSIALSGRDSDDHRPRFDLFQFGSQAAERLNPDDRVAVVFGREEWGLRLDELDRCNVVLEIPTTAEKTSMNLTSAVAVALSFFFNRFREDRPALRGEFLHPVKTDEDLFFSRVWKILDRVKFINPQNPSLHLPDLRAMYNRADLSERDLRILFGILSGVESQIFPSSTTKAPSSEPSLSRILK